MQVIRPITKILFVKYAKTHSRSKFRKTNKTRTRFSANQTARFTNYDYTQPNVTNTHKGNIRLANTRVKIRCSFLKLDAK